MKQHVQISLARLIAALLVCAAALTASTLLASCQKADDPSGSASASAAETVAPEAAASAQVEDKAASSGASSASASSSAAPVQPVHDPDAAIDAAVHEKLDSMTLDEKVAQLFIASPEALCSDGSTLLYVDDDVRSNLKKYPVGGLCLMGPNLEDKAQTSALLADLQRAAQDEMGLQLLLCVDEEGGMVARVSDNEAFGQVDPGDMRAIGDAGDANAARDVAKTMGSYLFDLGFNVDFAPVADVDTAEGSTMHDRSFGSDPELVASMVSAQVEGFTEAGVLCSAKHFPGIGSAQGDSHDESISIQKDASQLAAEDLVPFKAAIAAGVPMVMVGHVSCPSITGSNMPASFSPAIMNDLLRDELGFTGVVVTDALNMDAATLVYDSAQACVQAFKAGADMLLMPIDLDEAYQAMLDAVKSGDISEDRLDQSVTRILIMKAKYEKATSQQRADAEKKAADAQAKAEEDAKKVAEEEAKKAEEEARKKAEEEAAASSQPEQRAPASAANLNIAEDYRDSFVHGDKGAENQKYIMLHDTEGDSDAYGTIGYWDSSGAGVAAHFIVNKDGSVVQCVPLDKITHHAGFGDAGHNALYGVEDESRDDKVGTVPIGDWAPDYGMNSYSVGIEMVHVSGSGDYPEEQLAAVDALIAYIDSYYGFQSTIIDHKAWRTGNSDTSPEFASYLANYQDHRTHN